MSFSFSEKIQERDNANVLLVDALNLAFRWKHQKATTFAEDYLDTIASLARSYNCGKVILASDWGASTYRKNLSPEYKANREKLKQEQTEAEAEYFKKFIEEFNRALSLTQYTVLKYKGVEADDIAAYIVENRANFGFDKIWLISSDADWDLLIEENVNRFSYVTRKEITLDKWPHPIEPELYSSFKCLTGDKGDNVEGVKGIGPVKAAKIIENYGNIFDIYTSLPIHSKYKYIESLNHFGDKLLLNFELMDLRVNCDKAIGEENIGDIKRRLISDN